MLYRVGTAAWTRHGTCLHTIMCMYFKMCMLQDVHVFQDGHMLLCVTGTLRHRVWSPAGSICGSS